MELFETTPDGFVFYGDVLVNYVYTVFDTVTIPSRTRKIGMAALFCHREIRRVIIPDSVTEIGRFAFSECENLVEINLPKSLKVLSSSAFDGCVNLSGFNIAKSNENFTTKDGIIYDKNLSTVLRCAPKHPQSEVTLPKTVTKIGKNAFNRTRNVKKVSFNEITQIGYKAFSYSAIQDFYIGESLTDVGYASFSDCKNLSNFSCSLRAKNFVVNDGVLYSNDQSSIICFPAGKKSKEFKMPKTVSNVADKAFSGNFFIKEILSNGNFCSKDGVLYSSDGKTLIAYPNGNERESFVLDDDVTKTSGYLFQGNAHLKHVTLGNGLLDVEKHTFESSGIKTVEFGKNVRRIKWCAFSGCNNLTEVDASHTAIYELGGCCFLNCANLQKVILPATAKTVIRWSFYLCPKLKSVTYYGDVSNAFIDGIHATVSNDELKAIIEK